MSIDVVDLTDAHVDHIYDRLRPADRLEAFYSGTADPAVAKAQLARATSRRCVLVDGEPVALIGFTREVDQILAFFIGTPVVDRFPVATHKMALAFLQILARQHRQRRSRAKPDPLPIRTGVHERYVKSLRWVQRLGFVNTGKWFGTSPNRILVLEMNDQTRSR